MFNKKYIYLKTIYEEKNITKAAKKLYLSQPALSLYLKTIEEELECELFERSKSGLKITNIGIQYLNYLEQIQILDNEFYEFLKKNNNKNYPNKINFGITPWIGAYVTSKISMEFSKVFPEIDLNFIEGEGHTLKNLYENNKINCFISIDIISDFLDMNSTSKIELRDDTILVVVPKTLLSKKISTNNTNSIENPYELDIEAIKNQIIVSGQETQALHTCTNEIIKKYKLNPKSLMNFRNINNILDLVENGYGITFMPKFYIKKGPKMNNCFFFTDNDELFHYRRMLFYRNDKFKSFYEEFGQIILKKIFKNLT